MNTDRRVNKVVLMAGLMAFTGLSPMAFGQNALGDGRGLAANPRQGSGGRNYQRPSLEKEVQFRNAIATGNAPGGLSFRGDLGYQGPGEFAGELGSDALYSFRRDSLYSGLAGMGIRGTDAIQYQFAMTTGSRVTSNLIGNLSVSRYSGSSAAILPGGVDRGRIGDGGSPLSIDPIGNLGRSPVGTTGTLRSTSSYSSVAGLVPELVSVFERGIERDQYGLIATPLMGLVSTPMDSKKSRLQNSRNGSVNVEPIKTSYTDTVDAVRERAEAIRARAIEAAMDPGDATDGNDKEAMDRATNDWIAERLARLQRKVLGVPEPRGTDDPIEVIQPEDSALGGVVKDTVQLRDPMNPRPEGEGIEGGVIEEGAPEIGFDRGEGIAGKPLYSIDPETLELIRGDGKRVTYLVDPTAGDRNIYSEHMIAGEGLLKRHRYFDAEERFTHALAVRQGDVSAQLGRLHAQIGAGLVISASVNLQTLMSEHIEVVSRRYSGDLLPDEQRIVELIVNLRERAGLEDRPAYRMPETRQVRIACGLMISYLGYQVDDEQQMNEGFAVIHEHGSESDVRLVKLLSTVWGAVMAEPEAVESETLESELSP